MMFEDVDRKRFEQVSKEMVTKLKKYKDGYTESQRLLEAFPKDTDICEKKLAAIETKATKIVAKDKSLKKSLEVALRSKK